MLGGFSLQRLSDPLCRVFKMEIFYQSLLQIQWSSIYLMLKCFGSVLGVACCQIFDMASAPKKKRLSGSSQTAAPKKSKTMDDYAVPAWVPEVKRAVDTLRTWMSVPE